jgi:hypothetical protein
LIIGQDLRLSEIVVTLNRPADNEDRFTTELDHSYPDNEIDLLLSEIIVTLIINADLRLSEIIVTLIIKQFYA